MLGFVPVAVYKYYVKWTTKLNMSSKPNNHVVAGLVQVGFKSKIMGPIHSFVNIHVLY
jgi:hypothetical protein